jgi:hypothetical protein
MPSGQQHKTTGGRWTTMMNIRQMKVEEGADGNRAECKLLLSLLLHSTAKTT